MSRSLAISDPTRAAGILLHITCLPGRYGIGDLGPSAHAFVDALARAQQTWWQILPLGPPGLGDSPYQCLSAFAGNPNLISPELLIQDGLLHPRDIGRPQFPADRVNYECVTPFKAALLALAYDRYRAGAARRLRAAFDQFRALKFDWLDDYSLFMALRDTHNQAPWTNWPKPLVLRKRAALQSAHRELADAVDRHQFIQFLFHRQLDALRQHAQSKGIKLIGDLPIFVSPESADVWANPHLFLLDRNRRPTAVAGVPPDLFSKTGQRWGSALFNWHAMRKEGYTWWIDRVSIALNQVDLLRIDHFRGFAAFWMIPAHHPTAMHGRWIKAPGRELFATLQRKLGHLPFIAEDLGVITPDVVALRQEFGLPGMRVLQFAFGGGDSEHLPHNHERNSVAYTGTHDNDTTLGWYRQLRKADLQHLRRYAPGVDKDPAWEILRLAWASVANIAIAPLQDILSLGSEARMNLPGTASGNWAWRFSKDMLPVRILDRLAELTETYGRQRK